MKRKFINFIIFAILSITPFLRGCGDEVSIGFPFPVVIGEIHKDRGLSDIIPISEKLYVAVAYFMINLIIVIFLGLNFNEKDERKKMLIFALFINLIISWSLYYPYLGVMNIYYCYIFYVPYILLERVLFVPGGPGRVEKIAFDWVIRVWFVITIFLLSHLLWILKRYIFKARNKGK